MIKFKIPYNKPCYTGNEEKYIGQAIQNAHLAGNGYFSKKCEQWFENNLNIKRALLTPSATAALEMAALLLEIKEGDEIIMPSYTFVSTANAFALRGAKIVFVDIRKDTLNIDENLIEQAITNKTKAIVVVHYAGVSCEMDKILDIAQKYNLYVIEDAAQAMLSKYKDRYLGTIGDLGVFSFHETKNYTSGGEGGLLIINNEKFIERAEIIREKGTNRKQFFEGLVDKYTWVDLGSSYLMNEISAAYLYAQLEHAEEIKQARLKSWNYYFLGLQELQDKAVIELPYIPHYCEHNAHIFYIKVKDQNERKELLSFLQKEGILAIFHYIPLHLSVAGRKYGVFRGEDKYTTKESNRIIRLPLFYNIKLEEQEYIVKKVKEWFNNKKIKLIFFS